MAVKHLFLKIFLLALMLAPAQLWAAAFPVEEGPGCDPEYYDAMSARAEMEGQREIEIAQRLILKPDSVLEYSCFDQHLTDLGDAADDIFSDMDGAPLFPGHPPVAARLPPAFPNPLPLGLNGPNPPPGGMFVPWDVSETLDDTLDDLVAEPSEDYLADNFGHVFGGGTHVGNIPVCGAMGAVWEFLKCQDFDKDMFIALIDLPNNDPRDQPRACPDAGDRTAMWNAMIATAYPPPATPAAQGGMDEVETYVDRMLSGACGAAPPVPTGLVITRGGATYDDAVCPVPGCYYSNGSCN